jgi:hypothetical protein
MDWRSSVTGSSASDDQPAADDTRIAPDPFAAVLPALAALGAVASIASVNWVADDRTEGRARSKRKASAALRDLESCCIGLQKIFERFHKSPKLFAGEGGAAASPLKFGVHGPRVKPQAVKLFIQSINDIASMLVLATQNAFDVMAAIEDGEIDAPEALLYEFGEIQEELNKIIQKRLPLKEAVDTGTILAVRLTRLVQQLRSYKSEQAP